MNSENASLPSGGRSVTLLGRKIAVQDLAALAAFIVLFGWFFYVIRFGVNAVDEGLYYNIAQRVLRGERLLVDEWQVSQFSSFLLLLPVKLYTSAVGSAEGIILFMRWLYVAETGVLYWWLYSRYRRFGYGGLAGVALFCSFVPGDMFAVFYLTMALQGVMVLGTLLFVPCPKPRSPFVWVFSGVVFACTVLAQPPFCLIYFAYCVIVLVRRLRRRGQGAEKVPLLQTRVWLLVTLGVALTAIPVVLYFLLKSTVPEIIRIFPELFTDSEYDFRFEHFYNLIWKSLILGQTFGYDSAVVWVLLIAACGGVRLMRKKEAAAETADRGGKKKASAKKPQRLHSEQVRRLVFIIACCCLTASYIAGIVSFAEYKTDVQSHQLYMYHFYHSAPVAAFCAVCCLLLKKKSPFAEAFWWMAVAADLLIAYGSECACRLTGVTLFPMMFILARRLIAELNAAGKLLSGKRFLFDHKKFRAIVGAVSAAALCAMLCFESIGGYIARFYLPTEHYESGRTDLPLDHTLQRGPLKGVITNGAVADVYNATLADLDGLGSEGPVYIMTTCPYLYLHLEQEMGTYTSWYVEEDAFARQMRFMQLLPEKRPAVIYIPFADFVTYRIPEASGNEGAPPAYEQKLSWVRQYADCSVTEGRMGYIVHVSRWDIPALQEP